MISKLKGLIDCISDTAVILDVQGVGYQVFCSQKTLQALRHKEDKAETLYIETVVREDLINLYGFQSAFEQDIFRLLLKVQGVGMRVALGILSCLTPVEVLQAIQAQNKTAFAKADGVGPKLAQRIVNELKDKTVQWAGLMSSLDNTSEISRNTGRTSTLSSSEDSCTKADALSALMNLGYRASDVEDILNKTLADSPNTSLEDLIRVGLNQVSKVGRAS